MSFEATALLKIKVFFCSNKLSSCHLWCCCYHWDKLKCLEHESLIIKKRIMERMIPGEPERWRSDCVAVVVLPLQHHQGWSWIQSVWSGRVALNLQSAVKTQNPDSCIDSWTVLDQKGFSWTFTGQLMQAAFLFFFWFSLHLISSALFLFRHFCDGCFSGFSRWYSPGKLALPTRWPPGPPWMTKSL